MSRLICSWRGAAHYQISLATLEWHQCKAPVCHEVSQDDAASIADSMGTRLPTKGELLTLRMQDGN